MAVPTVSAAQLNPMIQLAQALSKGKDKAKKNKPQERKQATKQQQQASRAGAKGQESNILSQLAQVLSNGAQQGAKGSQAKSGLQNGGLQNAEGAAGADTMAGMDSQIAEFINELKKVLGNMKGKGDLRKAGKQLSKSDNPIAKQLGKMLGQAADKALDEDGGKAEKSEKKGGCCGKKDKAAEGADGMAQAGLNGMNAADGENNLRKAQGNDAADDASGENMRKDSNDPMSEINMEDQKAGEPFEDFLFRVMAAVTKDLQKEIRDQVKKIKALSAASAAAGAAGGPAAAMAADSKMLAMEKLKQLTQKLSQAFQALSNVQNSLHQAAMNSVRNIK